MNAKQVRKIVKDNKLNIDVRGRTNGMVMIEHSSDINDINTLNELLNGFGFALRDLFTGYMVVTK